MSETPDLPRRYRLVEPLGKGGEGAVWLAVDRFHRDRPVAVKCVSGALVAAKNGSDLSREFLTLRRLVHPHIARVRDFGHLTSGAGFYFTTDYVPGGNLIEWYTKVAPNVRWKLLLRVGVQALSVLEYLSRHRVVHGDIKPGNLLVSSDLDGAPALKVIDFGAAERRKTIPTTGTRGTPPYRPSPAWRLHGSQHDLYGLGMALYHAATGALPFPLGDRAALLAWWKQSAALDLRCSAPTAPKALHDLLAGLTAPPDSPRFASAREALEFVHDKIGLVSVPASLQRVDLLLPAREELAKRLLDELHGTQAPFPLHVIQGPPGSGRGLLLEALASGLQVDGHQTVIFFGPHDHRAEIELRKQLLDAGAAQDLSERDSVNPSASVLAAETALHAETAKLAFLVHMETRAEHSQDAESSQRFDLLLEGLRLRGGFAIPLVIAAPRAAELTRRWGLSAGEIRVHEVQLFGKEEVAEQLREGLGVDEVPADLVRRITEESGGVLERILDALRRLIDLGAAADSNGHLHLPAKLPERLVARRDLGARGRELPAPLRRALGAMALAGEPLDPAMARARFSGVEGGLLEGDAWDRAFSALEGRGLVKRVRGGAGRFVLASPVERDTAAEILGREATAAHGSYLEFLETPEGQEALRQRETLAAACRAVLRGPLPAAKALSRALQWGLRAARSFERAGDFEEARRLHQDVVGGARGAPSLWKARAALHAARLSRRMGHLHDALAFLDDEQFREIPRLGRIAMKQRGVLSQQIGNLEDARTQFESLLQEISRTHSPDTPEILDLRVMLASLDFDSGRREQGLKALQAGRDLLERARDPTGRAQRLALAAVFGRFAGLESRFGESRWAILFLQESLRLARESGRRELQIQTLNELGILHARNRQWNNALSVFSETEALARRSGDQREVLQAVYNRALIHYRLFDLDRAEQLFMIAREVSDRLGRHPLAATVWLGLAGVLREKEQLVRSIRLYRKVLRFPEGLLRRNDRAVAHNNLGEIYVWLGRPGRALECVSDAHAIAEETGNRFLLGLTYRLRGILHWVLGKPEEARADLERALAADLERGDSRGSAASLYYLGHCLRAVHDEPEKVIAQFRRALVTSRAAADRPHQQASTIALFTELLRHGRRKQVGRLLKAHRRRRTRWLRHGLAVAVLELRTASEWPDNSTRASVLCHTAEREGRLWESFCVLGETLADPLLDAGCRTTMAVQRSLLGARLAKHVPESLRPRFQSAWDLTGSDVHAWAASAFPVGAQQGCEMSDPLFEGLVMGKEADDVLEDLLTFGRTWVGSRGLGVILDPERDERRCIFPRHEIDPGALAVAATAALAQRAEDEGVSTVPPFVFVRLPHPEARRFLCAEYAVSQSSIEWEGLERLRQIAALVALRLRLDELQTRLGQEERLHGEARDELRRLNAQVAKGRQELETAILTQRLELLGIQESGDITEGRSAPPPPPLVGESPALRSVLRRLPALAASDLPVLILGESGTGKDLLARWLHELGPRRDRPFLSEVCHLVESLAEAELFGFVKGAFTDAIQDRPGLFHLAAGGTVYLDEVSDLPETLQAKLLRVLEERRVRPLGAVDSVTVDFRLLSSSRQGLEELRSLPGLRDDFFYRINSEVIELPPLRERKEDVAVLVRHFLEIHARQTGAPLPYVPAETLARLEAHSWPGNVRELENELRRLLASRPLEISPEQILRKPALETGHRPDADVVLPTLKEERLRGERSLLERALHVCGGNASAAARRLGVTRRYLGKLLEKHALRLKDWKA